MTEPTERPIPVGPADIKYSRRALARLAFSAAAQELADSAAAAVPTTSDAYGSAYDDVEFARRLVRQAEEVLRRAIVHGRDRGGSWDDIGAALDITEDEAESQYSSLLTEWEDALDRPSERSGQFLSSRLPSGLFDPDFTVGYLDKWCVRHVEDGARCNADAKGEIAQMVSANLPKHSTLTELNREWRVSSRLMRENIPFDHPEYVAMRERREDLNCRHDAEFAASEAGQLQKRTDDLRERALKVLAETSGMQWKAYNPRGATRRYVVTIDGRHIGDIRPLAVRFNGERHRVLTWDPDPAVCTEDPIGPHKTVKAAAEALAALDARLNTPKLVRLQ